MRTEGPEVFESQPSPLREASATQASAVPPSNIASDHPETETPLLSERRSESSFNLPKQGTGLPQLEVAIAEGRARGLRHDRTIHQAATDYGLVDVSAVRVQVVKAPWR